MKVMVDFFFNFANAPKEMRPMRRGNAITLYNMLNKLDNQV